MIKHLLFSLCFIMIFQGCYQSRVIDKSFDDLLDQFSKEYNTRLRKEKISMHKFEDRDPRSKIKIKNNVVTYKEGECLVFKRTKTVQELHEKEWRLPRIYTDELVLKKVDDNKTEVSIDKSTYCCVFIISPMKLEEKEFLDRLAKPTE
ncbi:MAG: hypothetical protein HRU15_05755 [Planctomycetes bacterium]|nr:hypothetical protein [Planctomycetota bacterium]